MTGVAEPERVDGINATFRLLPMLGVQPILGRAFVGADNDGGSPEVVMLGHGYWQRRFGGDPAVVGRRIMVDGTAREIIGVLPQGFWFMDMTARPRGAAPLRARQGASRRLQLPGDRPAPPRRHPRGRSTPTSRG